MKIDERIASFIDHHAKGDAELIGKLHNYLIRLPGISASIHLGVPFYRRKHWLCYINPQADGGVELAFPNAYLMNGLQEKLNFGKRSQVGGIILRTTSELTQPLIAELVQTAIFIDNSLNKGFPL
ncbi:DUF1801 domain-containing protein [Luteibaculum oceani]|uniref:DUF1801 domain-containing protein n=1 Tax=Luteibaculum oceani TaxID=1294296 RepID=A0A5C6VKM7_9FLAO|nr:DUF1801 domain-containing protein [Luteibaculum oceani]TXC85244.1 DUF1801 domain-containing protein [Luteibaculum oceani]